MSILPATPNSSLPSLATFAPQFAPFRPSRTQRAMLLLWKHRRMIGSTVGAAAALTLVAVMLMRPAYTAKASLLIDSRRQRLEIPTASIFTVAGDRLATEYQLLRSRSIASSVIADLGLGRDLRAHGAPRVGAGAADSATLEAYLADLGVESRPGSRLVTVSFTGGDPALAARIANAHARAYIRLGMRHRGVADDQTQQFLAEKLVSLRKRIEKSEAALNAYRRRTGIVSEDDTEGGALKRLDQINQNLARTEADEISLEAQEQLIRSRSYDSLPAVINNELIQKLKEQLVASAARRASLAAKYRPGFPALDEAIAQETNLRMQLREEIHRVADGIESAYLTAAAKEKHLRDAIRHEKAVALSDNDEEVKYGILTRDVRASRQLYDNVLERMKEASLAADANASNAVLVDEAMAPRWPSSPNRMRDVGAAILLSFCASMLAAFVLEAFDGTLKNPEDVERYLGVPTLAAVPNFRQPALNGRRVAQLESRADADSCELKDVPGPNHSAFAASEAYRALRSAIILSAGEQPPKTTLFTSATEAEGKTMTAVNTAIAFAHLGMRVALVDADLRRPRCHRALGIENLPGLTEVLGGTLAIEGAIQETPFEGLSAITAGAIPANSADLVGSARMEQTLKWLRDRFDFVVIDSCPMMLVSDAVPIAAMVDGAVLVINGPQTPRHLALGACMQLRSVGTRVFGAVLNLVDFESPDFYYSRYAYGYRHSSYYNRSVRPAAN